MSAGSRFVLVRMQHVQNYDIQWLKNVPQSYFGLQDECEHFGFPPVTQEKKKTRHKTAAESLWKEWLSQKKGAESAAGRRFQKSRFILIYLSQDSKHETAGGK